VINLEHIVEEVLFENANVAGPGGALGAGVASTETAFSGDNYARGDARVPKILGGVTRRSFSRDSIYAGGVSKRRKHKRKHKRKHRRRR